MGRFDRYMLGELLKMFGFFALVLVSVYWVNRAVVLFDQLIADGQSARVFLELTTLSLPNIIRITLPLAAFAAALYVTNRLARDSELVVMQATGFSPFRLVRPVLVFGLLSGVLMLVLTHLLVPLSQGRLALREAQIAQNVTARLLVPDRFIDPAAGVTVYIREITPAGELVDIFLSDRRDGDRAVTYTARKAWLVRGSDGPRLVMLDGRAQTLRHADQRLFVTGFSEFSHDIGALITLPDPGAAPMKARSTAALLRADAATQQETGRDAARLRFEGHSRFNQAALCVIAALLGFAPLMLGGFSRFGFGPQMAGAAGLVIAVMAIDSAAAETAKAGIVALTYAAPVAGAAVTAVLLWAATQGPRPRRRRAAA